MKKANDAEVLGNWWKTSIIDMEPGRIEFRGHPIQDLIGTVTFPQMIWLMIRGIFQVWMRQHSLRLL